MQSAAITVSHLDLVLQTKTTVSTMFGLTDPLEMMHMDIKWLLNHT